MSSPLNLNLIIPFKDNKGDRLILYVNEIQAFRESITQYAAQMNHELKDLCGDNFELTIAARSDGTSRKYYWRFKSSKRDRKYNRLCSDSIMEYVETLSDAVRLRLKEIELELIYVNANLKLIKGMLDAIKQCHDEFSAMNLAKF